MGHYDLTRLPAGASKYEDGVRRREGGPVEKYTPLRCPPGLPEPSTFLADLEKSTQSFLSQQRASQSLSSQYELEGAGKTSSVLKNLPGHSRHLQGPAGSQAAPLGLAPDTMLIYDEFLQQHRRPVSKLDLEEKRKREAREKGSGGYQTRSQFLTAPLFVGIDINGDLVATGYYYEVDDSYDESDEEEVRAHLRRVAEQPPLKLDDSTEVQAPHTHFWAGSDSGTQHHAISPLSPETGLSPSGWSDHREPARGAHAAEAEEEEEDAQGAKPFAPCFALQTHSSSSAPAQHSFHP